MTLTIRGFIFCLVDRNEKLLSVVVKTTRIKENDRLLTLLSPDIGVYNLTVYGAQKSKKCVKASLYTEAVFSVYHNKERAVRSLVDLEVISIHEQASSSLGAIFTSSLMSELVMLYKGETFLPLYELFTSCLDELDDENYVTIATQFMIRYMKLSGLLPDFIYCPVCGRAYDGEETLGYNSSFSVPCCSNCDNISSGLILPKNARAYIRDSANAPLSKALEFVISPMQASRIMRYMLRYIGLSLGVELKVMKSGLIDATFNFGN